MSAAVPLRDDFHADVLRRFARRSRDAGWSRRLLALAAIYDDARRTEAARIGAIAVQMERDWTLPFNAEGPASPFGRQAPGNPPKLNAVQRQALA